MVFEWQRHSRVVEVIKKSCKDLVLKVKPSSQVKVTGISTNSIFSSYTKKYSVVQQSSTLHGDKLPLACWWMRWTWRGVFTFLRPEYLSPHDSIAETPRRQYLAHSITLIHSLHIHISFGLGFNESHGNFTTTGVSERTHRTEKKS